MQLLAVLRGDPTNLPGRPVPDLLADVPAAERALVIAAAATALAAHPDRKAGLGGGPAGWVLHDTRTVATTFSAQTAADLLAATGGRGYDEGEWRRCVQALATVPADERPSAAAAALVDAAPAGADPLVVLGLATVVDGARQESVTAGLRQRVYADELERTEVLGAVDLPLEVLAAMLRVPRSTAEAEPQPPGVPVLAASPAYLAVAESLLTAAAERLEQVQAGKLPYAADAALSYESAHSVARAARVLLHAGVPAAGPLVQRLLPSTAVAPTAAKTLPSQALCIALAQAVAAEPTPPAVEALAAARRVVRHAGVAKKLDRLLPVARRSLARRPAAADAPLPDLGFTAGVSRTAVGGWTAVTQVGSDLRVGTSWERPDGQSAAAPSEPLRREYPQELRRVREVAAAARSVVATARSRLEARLIDGRELPEAQWRALLAHPLAGLVASGLVWTVGGVAVLPDAEGFRGSGGAPVQPGRGAARLWHPVEATPQELAAWRDLLVARQLRQPFPQVFRERYPVPPDGRAATVTAVFAGFTVATRPLLGLAVRRGWRADDAAGCLLLAVGTTGWTAGWTVPGPLHPGADGTATSGELVLQPPQAPVPAALAEVPPVVLSEAFREVDLLLSTAATGPADLPPGEQAEVRREALARVLRGLPQPSRVQLGRRHLEVVRPDGRWRVSLATALVFGPDGAQVQQPDTGPPGATPLPWLPYDEAVFERIVAHALRLLTG